MTPEREKYYRGISNEERAIRVLLIYKRYELSKMKCFVATTGHKTKDEKSTELIEYLHSIKVVKFQIECIKRQLPAPLKYYLDYHICCRCGMHYKRSEIAGTFYCKKCGQAIRPESW